MIHHHELLFTRLLEIVISPEEAEEVKACLTADLQHVELFHQRKVLAQSLVQLCRLIGVPDLCLLEQKLAADPTNLPVNQLWPIPAHDVAGFVPLEGDFFALPTAMHFLPQLQVLAHARSFIAFWTMGDDGVPMALADVPEHYQACFTMWQQAGQQLVSGNMTLAEVERLFSGLSTPEALLGEFQLYQRFEDGVKLELGVSTAQRILDYRRLLSLKHAAAVLTNATHHLALEERMHNQPGFAALQAFGRGTALNQHCLSDITPEVVAAGAFLSELSDLQIKCLETLPAITAPPSLVDFLLQPKIADGEQWAGFIKLARSLARNTLEDETLSALQNVRLALDAILQLHEGCGPVSLGQFLEACMPLKEDKVHLAEALRSCHDQITWLNGMIDRLEGDVGKSARLALDQVLLSGQFQLHMPKNAYHDLTPQDILSCVLKDTAAFETLDLLGLEDLQAKITLLVRSDDPEETAKVHRLVSLLEQMTLLSQSVVSLYVAGCPYVIVKEHCASVDVSTADVDTLSQRCQAAQQEVMNWTKVSQVVCVRWWAAVTAVVVMVGLDCFVCVYSCLFFIFRITDCGVYAGRIPNAEFLHHETAAYVGSIHAVSGAFGARSTSSFKFAADPRWQSTRD